MPTGHSFLSLNYVHNLLAYNIIYVANISQDVIDTSLIKSNMEKLIHKT